VHPLISDVALVAVHQGEELLEVLARQDLILDHIADCEGYTREDVAPFNEEKIENGIRNL
jgi:hypothetical protein